MRSPLSFSRTLAVLGALFFAPAAAAVPTAPGYLIEAIATPGPAVGDVAVAGGAVFVGVGSFGAGTQEVVRIDENGATTIATGFNSLAGFAYDAVNDRLFVGDNAGELSGALTGDTVFSIANPFGTPGTPPSAATLEVLAAGSLPGVSDLILDPNDPTGNTLLVGDASANFPPTGSIVEVNVGSGVTSVLQSGLAFTAGLAGDPNTLFFGEALLDFSGQVSTLALGDIAATPEILASLAGNFDLELLADGGLLSSTGGSILRIDPSTGTFVEIATGFGFTGGLAVDGDVIYVVDGFPAVGEENIVWRLTPVPEPGALLLVGLGLSGLAWRSRGRRCDPATSARG